MRTGDSSGSVRFYTVKISRTQELKRVIGVCPKGHEIVDTPATSTLASRLQSGDFSDEWCTRCGWQR